MKTTACITIWLTATMAFASNDLSPMEELKQLRAENHLLKAQIKSLKRRLKELKSSTQPTPKTTTRPGTQTAPATQEDQTPKASGPTRVSFVVHENNPKWWQNPAELTREIETRQMIGRARPQHGVRQWLARNNWFAGRQATWKLKPTACDEISEATAGERYFRILKLKEIIAAKLKKYRADPRAANDETLQRATAIAELQNRSYEAQGVQYKALMEAKGGVMIRFRVAERGGLAITLAVPSGKSVPLGVAMDISARVASVDLALGDDAGSILATMVATK